jgi:hypothetical protein
MEETDLEQLIVSEGERTRKYFDALAEKLARLEARQDLLDAHVLSAESRVAGIDVHVANAEKVQKVVLTEVRGLATKVDRLTRTRGRPIP